jgi:predicted permease
MLDTIAHDVRYGLRSLMRTKLATTVMTGSIALGIAVATAVFTLADVMLFRPLPYRDAERLVVPYQTLVIRAGARRDTVPWTLARYEVLKSAVQGFEDAGFAAWVDGIVRIDDEDRPVRIEAITPSLFSTLSIRPQAGRLFGVDEDAANVASTAAMISDRLWRREFGGDASLVGGTIMVNGTAISVVGIMPAGFNGFAVGADVWIPTRMAARIDPSPRWTERLAVQPGTVIARMGPGLTTNLIQRELNAALPLIDATAGDGGSSSPEAQRGIGVMLLAEARRHPLVKPMLQLMGVAVLGLLLTVCANIASILLARGHARRNEIGVRIALGASQRRVGRQVLTESAVLAAFGLPPGILLGYLFADGLASLRPALPQSWVLLRGTDLLAGASLAPNPRVLLFSCVVAGLAALIFGIGPALVASRTDPAKLITSAGDSHTAAPVRGRQFLVMAQIALATVLLVTAGLMTRSLRAMLDTDLGFRADGVVAFRMTSIDTSAAARIRRHEFLTGLTGTRGVLAAATSGCVPFDLTCMFTSGVRSLAEADASAPSVQAELHQTSSDYFRTLGIPLVAGRAFLAEDTTTGQPRVVISDAAAKRLFGNVPAVGKVLALDGLRGPPVEVVGVVADVHFRSVDAAATPAVYFLSGEDASAPRFGGTLFVRTTGAPGAAIAAITRVTRASGVPMGLSEARALTDVVRAETSSTRFIATLLVGFAASAVLLAGLGIYGVIAYIVVQRAREFGVRLVLGANERDLLRGVLGRGAAMVAGGVVIGAFVAVAASKVVAALLYGVESFDATTYAVVIAIVTSVGLLATFIPARRIARIAPSDALRA